MWSHCGSEKEANFPDWLPERKRLLHDALLWKKGLKPGTTLEAPPGLHCRQISVCTQSLHNNTRCLWICGFKYYKSVILDLSLKPRKHYTHYHLHSVAIDMCTNDGINMSGQDGIVHPILWFWSLNLVDLKVIILKEFAEQVKIKGSACTVDTADWPVGPPLTLPDWLFIIPTAFMLRDITET